MDGDPVHKNRLYYILSVNGTVDEGGLRYISYKYCKYQIIQEKLGTPNGHFWVFSNLADHTTIDLSNDISIGVGNLYTVCSKEPVWIVEQNGYVDGDVSYGHNADDTKFKIEKDDKGDGYRIVHCGNSNGCKNVGVVIEKNGRRRIALTESPLVVKFKKFGDFSS
uniref:Uncharacterized protein n=2 Tax=Nicotiana TaxID=4085 RepID=A0A1S3YKA8_TOBAC|nr:PREDICTED: uncharacterized protein LOC107777201 [Nicotiana tabacum]